MMLRIKSLKARRGEMGIRTRWEDIERETGIPKQTLLALGHSDPDKRPRTVRGEYISALCKYFDVGPTELIQVDDVALPLNLDIRPDRHGKSIGE